MLTVKEQTGAAAASFHRILPETAVCPAGKAAANAFGGPLHGSTSQPGKVRQWARLPCRGWLASGTALPTVVVTVLLPTGSVSASSDGLCDVTEQ